MLLDRVACRPAVSAASVRHCPAIDCRVAMSTFTGSSSDPGPSRSRRTLGRPRRHVRRVVHRPAGCPQVRRERPRGAVAGRARCAGDRTVRRPTGGPRAPPGAGPLARRRGRRRRRGDRARRRPRSATSCPPSARALGRAGRRASGPGSSRLARRPAAHRARARPRRGPRAGRPGAGGDRRARSSALELRVVGGPDAGRGLPLGQGRHVIGRGSDVQRPARRPRRLPAARARSDVGGGSISVADLGSTNGSRLDDAELDDRPRPLAGRARSCGSARAPSTVAGPGGADRGPGARRPAGGRRLRPAPRLRVPRAGGRGAPSPRPPAAAPAPRLAWVAVALPGGRRRAHGLAAAHPDVPVLRPAEPGRGAGHLALRALVGPAQRAAGRRRPRASSWLAAEAPARRRGAPPTSGPREAAHPDLAALAAAARRRTAPAVEPAPAATPTRSRSGSGTGPGHHRVTRIEADGARVARVAPHVPVAVDLRATGGLAVVGPRERALGALRARPRPARPPCTRPARSTCCC